MIDYTLPDRVRWGLCTLEEWARDAQHRFREIEHARDDELDRLEREVWNLEVEKGQLEARLRHALGKEDA